MTVPVMLQQAITTALFNAVTLTLVYTCLCCSTDHFDYNRRKRGMYIPSSVQLVLLSVLSCLSTGIAHDEIPESDGKS